MWRIGKVVLVVLVLMMTLARPVLANGPIVLDSNMGEWDGHPYVEDPPGDADKENDIRRLYFDTNPNEETLYFMLERWASDNTKLEISLFLDTNNNGNYGEPGDRRIFVRYQPKNQGSQVDVEVYDGTGGFIAQIAHNADWGESRQEGGLRVEWGVPFDVLGIIPGQTMLMFAATTHNQHPDRIEDTTQEVQWSPANALGWPLIGVVALSGALLLARQRRRLS
ncbi:hypothetical protein [Ardenticatena maritima]|uniref:Carbohydrate-binding domain-containing protein n=1 Tax=Ardenticatena maritima TaxID=872965 RepID=A0A0P6YAA4_9CHLR|nr:hypothetical protein [Ardenticatena maritima]KPL88629.1 hypothetical protein SE16_07800 [Ardenticatena maritima]